MKPVLDSRVNIIQYIGDSLLLLIIVIISNVGGVVAALLVASDFPEPLSMGGIAIATFAWMVITPTAFLFIYGYVDPEPNAIFTQMSSTSYPDQEFEDMIIGRWWINTGHLLKQRRLRKTSNRTLSS